MQQLMKGATYPEALKLNLEFKDKIDIFHSKENLKNLNKKTTQHKNK